MYIIARIAASRRDQSFTTFGCRFRWRLIVPLSHGQLPANFVPLSHGQLPANFRPTSGQLRLLPCEYRRRLPNHRSAVKASDKLSQLDATMEWCRLWPKRNGGAASTQTSNQTLNRWFGGANRPAETNARNRCQSAERRVSVPGNSLVYPRRTPEFSQLDATMEWWRLWPKRSGGGGGIRTNGMLCVPLCFFGVFSALQALRNPRQTSSL